MINLDIKPQRPAIIKGYKSELYALVKASAEEKKYDIEKGLPLNIAIVIDRSGSMAGQPLEEAKKSAVYIVNKMRDIDRIAIVAYDNRVEIVTPSQQCLNKTSIIEAIESIRQGGQTDLHSGWLAGAEEVAKNKSPNSLNRVLLLSDGNANSGEISIQRISNQCSQLADEGIITSTYGLGFNFNEALMIDMSRAGLGQSYYGETAEDLLDPFKEEFDLLTNTIAWNLKLDVTAPNFVKFQIMNNFKAVQDRQACWHLPDVAEGGDAWALFKLEIDEKENLPGSIEVLRCNLFYETKIDGKTKKHSVGPSKLILDRLDAEAFSSLAEDEEVNRRVEEILIADMQQEAREASLRGDWQRVNQIILKAKTIAGSNEWLQGSLEELEKYALQRKQEEFSKGAMYNAAKMHRRLSSKLELGSMSYDMSDELDKQAYLRRKMNRGKRMPRL